MGMRQATPHVPENDMLSGPCFGMLDSVLEIVDALPGAGWNGLC
jgi:hypothetical protein